MCTQQIKVLSRLSISVDRNVLALRHLLVAPGSARGKTGGINRQFHDRGSDNAADHRGGDSLHHVAPAPWLHRIGARPAMMTQAVMAFGRTRFTAP